MIKSKQNYQKKLEKNQHLINNKNYFILQRSVASKGYLETVTWSFTDSKINQLFKENKKK